MSANPLRLRPEQAVPYRLIVARNVWQKLMAYVLACPIEVAGYGYITRIGHLGFMVDDVFILDQVASGGHAEISAETMATHMTRLLQAGGDTGVMRLQWHSHVHGPAIFSSTDDTNVENYGTGWMISIVLNKRGDFQARLDLLTPFRQTWPIEVVIMDQPDEHQLAVARREIATHVSEQRLIRRPSVKPTTVSGTYQVPAGNVQEV